MQNLTTVTRVSDRAWLGTSERNPDSKVRASVIRQVPASLEPSIEGQDVQGQDLNPATDSENPNIIVSGEQAGSQNGSKEACPASISLRES